MGMPSRQAEWTADEVLALPDDGNRYEVIDGALLVTPSPNPRHQRAVGALYAGLREYLRGTQIGFVHFSPADIRFSDRRLVQPDVFVTPRAGRTAPLAWVEVRELIMVTEVLSPRTARHDRGSKRRLYQEEGVPEYWIIDVAARLVERWRPEDDRPEILSERIEWRPAGALVPLVLELGAFFDEVHFG